jgi:YegS/Rv2252/BmrU family lipid kinase
MLALIVNPSAGDGRAGRVLPEVLRALARRGLEHHVEQTRSLEHAAELALTAQRAGEIAVTLGGDGLVGAVASALRYSDGVLGVLPGGRGNDFARVLGIPLHAPTACDVLAHGRVRVLDLGEVSGRTFVGIASCGFDSVANRIANETRLVRGNLVYTYGGLRALVNFKPASFELELDGVVRTLEGMTVAIANTAAYGGGMMLAPDAKLDDGLFDVVLIGITSRMRFLRGLRRVFKGTHVELPGVEIVRAREVRVDGTPRYTVYADGDPVHDLPVQARCLPGAIRVIAPF